MCLSTVFEVKDGAEPVQVVDKVGSAEVCGDELTFVDIFGGRTVLSGRIESVDLLENKIFVRALG